MSKQKKVQEIWISHPCTELLAAGILSAFVMTNNVNLSHFAWHLGLCFLHSLFLSEQGTVCDHCFSFSPASCPKTRLRPKIIFFFFHRNKPHINHRILQIIKLLASEDSRKSPCSLTKMACNCEPWQIPTPGFWVSQAPSLVFFKTGFSCLSYFLHIWLSRFSSEFVFLRVCKQTRTRQKKRTDRSSSQVEGLPVRDISETTEVIEAGRGGRHIMIMIASKTALPATLPFVTFLKWPFRLRAFSVPFSADASSIGYSFGWILYKLSGQVALRLSRNLLAHWGCSLLFAYSRMNSHAAPFHS